MYEAYFGFTERPFAAIPRSDRYFPAAAVEAARQTLIRCIDRFEGCGLIVGPAGTGKTLLCQVLADHFQPRLDVVLLSSIHLGSSKEMLQAIAFELGLPYKRLEEGELRLSLIDRISPREKSREGLLLIVDEAHALSPKVLEELRLLTNLVRGGTARVRLLLAGAPVLDERFASPRLASFNQRLAARCYLEPFSAEETREYVRAHTAVAGADPDSLWTAEALRAVHHATDGCPRLINQLCDLTLMFAADASASQVDDAVVNEAWAELQQLPMPWNVDQRGAKPPAEVDEAAAATAVVEFGSLDDVVAPAGAAVEGGSAKSESVKPESVKPETISPETAEPEPAPPAFVPTQPVGLESLAAERDEHLEQLPEFDEAASNVPIEVSADPTSQVDQIEAHLASVEKTFVRDDYDWPRVAEKGRCQVELVFDETTPPHPTAQLRDAETGTGGHLDEEDEAIAIGQSVIVKDFAGLEGDTVLRLSPSPRAVSADDLEHDPVADGPGNATDEEIDVEPVLEMDRPKESWLSGLARVMEQPATPDLKPFEEPAREAQPAADAAQALEAKAQAAALHPIEANFVELQYVHETAQVIDNDHHDPVAPMPSIVVEYTADHPAGHDGREEVSAAAEIRPSEQEHPTIPVRQREYRQLFAKLRQREMQDNR